MRFKNAIQWVTGYPVGGLHVITSPTKKKEEDLTNSMTRGKISRLQIQSDADPRQETLAKKRTCAHAPAHRHLCARTCAHTLAHTPEHTHLHPCICKPMLCLALPALRAAQRPLVYRLNDNSLPAVHSHQFTPVQFTPRRFTPWTVDSREILS